MRRSANIYAVYLLIIYSKQLQLYIISNRKEISRNDLVYIETLGKLRTASFKQAFQISSVLFVHPCSFQNQFFFDRETRERQISFAHCPLPWAAFLQA